MSTISIETNNKKYAVQLHNGHIAIFSESQNDEVLIFSVDFENGIYRLHQRRYLKEVESYILLSLLSEPGIVVSNTRLQGQGVNGKNITSSNLRQAILSLRNLFGDNTRPHQIIQNKARIGYSIQNATVFYEDTHTFLQTMSVEPENNYPLAPCSDIKNFSPKELKLVNTGKGLTEFFLPRRHFGKFALVLANFMLILYCIFNFLAADDPGRRNAAGPVLNTHIEIVNQNFNLVIIRDSKSDYLPIDQLKKALLNFLPHDDNSVVFEAIFIQNNDSLQLICLSSSDFSHVKNFRFTAQDLKSERYLDRLATQCLSVN